MEQERNDLRASNTVNSWTPRRPEIRLVSRRRTPPGIPGAGRLANQAEPMACGPSERHAEIVPDADPGDDIGPARPGAVL
jgi:hypothetical protein